MTQIFILKSLYKEFSIYGVTVRIPDGFREPCIMLRH